MRNINKIEEVSSFRTYAESRINAMVHITDSLTQ
jgi:hypothetical protein